MTFVSATCKGEVCRCGMPAVRKIGEEIPYDDPRRQVPGQGGHNLTAYVCEACFQSLFGHPTGESVEFDIRAGEARLRRAFAVLTADPDSNFLAWNIGAQISVLESLVKSRSRPGGH